MLPTRSPGSADPGPARRSRLLAGAALGAVALGLWLAWPSPFDPASYRPPPPPALTGALAPNRDLLSAQRVGEGEIRGPEDMAWDEQGRLHTGTADGRIVREAADGRFEEVARTGGRPLGLCFDGAGGLIVCDSSKGLLRLDREGRLVSLAKGAGGVAFGLTNAVAVARDGTLYFSDSSWKYPREHLLLDLLEARPYGRLLAYDPDRGQTRVLAGGLFFANGVALSRDESFVLVAETYRYRITRHWLKGPRAGVTDVFAENLPGFPDGVSWNGRDTFWVALYTTRDPLAERLQPRPWAKRLVARLPTALWGRPRPYGLVLALDEHGRVLRTLHEPEGRRLRFVTSARERQGALYLGTLEDPWLGRYTLPAPGSSR